jgi:hypothetical protein
MNNNDFQLYKDSQKPDEKWTQEVDGRRNRIRRYVRNNRPQRNFIMGRAMAQAGLSPRRPELVPG